MAKKTWTGATDSTYATAGNWDEGSAPVATNAVWLQGSVAITGSDQSGTAIDELLDELAANIGSSTTYLQLDPDSMEVNYSGSSAVHYIDVGAAAISPVIKSTSKPDSDYGMYLQGSGLATLTMHDGKVAIAALLDETATVATIRVHSGTLLLGSGVSLTTLQIFGGTVIQSCASTTTTLKAGTLTTQGSGAIGTLEVEGGNAILNSTGTITTLNHSGGKVDAVGKRYAKTITTYSPTPTGNPVLVTDDDLVTISTWSKPAGTATVQYSS